MKKIILLILVLISLTAKSEDRYKLELTQMPLISQTDRIIQYMITIKNISNQNLWIFFEDDPDLIDRDIIVNRFKRNNGGDMSLFQWMADINVDWEFFIPELNSTFFKILSPGLKFTIISTKPQIQLTLIEKLRILSNDDIAVIFHPLSTFPPETPPSYQPDVLLIP